MKNNILVVAAHPDDEILGAGGAILKHIKENDRVGVLILGDGERSRDFGGDVEKRERQAKKVAELLNITNLFLKKLPDNQLDSLPLLRIIKTIESYLIKLKPNIIYTHIHTVLTI